MKEMNRLELKISGVPEHFNLAWNLTIENDTFKKVGIDLKWQSVPEGSGRISQMLRNGETDIAIILTESIIKDMACNGIHSKIIQQYVQSPLIWGIHVSGNSSIDSIDELENKRIAISRFGSGSHLMSLIFAKSKGWDISKMEFVIVNTLDGAIDALSNAKADYFMWERFMTKPIVDQGIFKRIGDCPTPWPCFVIVARNQIIQNYSNEIDKILDIINHTTRCFKQNLNIDLQISQRFNLKINDVQDWLTLTEWSQSKLDMKTFQKIQDQLFDLNQIENKNNFEKVTYQ
ncbi:hypothetical protein DLAC_04305 [Tieghemostelium lacteum]|uniref:Ca3427-like PBP 2 domain-containing protein n=1 Tax=Tieghemostelium lacteum TaxID=361077 RepID=A0A151ZJ63_TIELA|nr:hypothetical protein DLAC_04305 [Tieghemostelium lacteum]|eukprot:KYQ94032.1 hypothetical protein DLAC_04305 [Tieghemostelium lacteum]